MAKVLDPVAVADKTVTRAVNAAGDYKKGVQAVTESPTVAAAKNLEKAKVNFAKAVDSGKMAARLNAVNVADWIAATAGKGADRYPTGIQAAKPKILKFMTQFLPHVQTVKARVDAMPSTSLSDNIQRMVANVQGLAEFVYKP